MRVAAVALLLAWCPAAIAQSATAQSVLPDRVTFRSLDDRTTLVGYVYAPRADADHPAAPAPAVVMMHGRAGAYSSLANGKYDASTISQRHQMWGELWAEHGYVAILVDGFGPRGYPHGFPQHSYDERPEAVNEVTVRPLDAYGAIKFLRTRGGVIPDRIGLQGWSNGASAALAAMAQVAADTPGAVMRGPRLGFRAALALYPACGLKGIFDDGYLPYAPVKVLQGDADEEVSPRRCASFVEKSRAHGGDIDIMFYPGATHGFDDPGPRRQNLNANVAAKADALTRARAFFDAQVRGLQPK
ncbi:MAG: dienelactone hydrolase family protein [Xanthobacteraceae bacterium]